MNSAFTCCSGQSEPRCSQSCVGRVSVRRRLLPVDGVPPHRPIQRRKLLPRFLDLFVGHVGLDHEEAIKGIGVVRFCDIAVISAFMSEDNDIFSSRAGGRGC